MRIIDAALLCAWQWSALRTRKDNSDDPFIRNCNFIAILKWFANVDNTLKNNLENGPGNVKMCLAQVKVKIVVWRAPFVGMKIGNVFKETK